LISPTHSLFVSVLEQVRVFRFITEGTVEEKIVERADRKLFLDAAVIQQGRFLDKLQGSLSKGEVMEMVWDYPSAPL
jgi:hypothetical protein